ncbi:MAG TPA: AtpZ/AtpI family protein [Pelagibacteraceae bacterium]|jgi:ATP synthase protein I|nr:AtpZ/AtpI family protein [Pelagibacteraceae bacterium]|tara:strand:- start:70 stop:360 length:291 start_codon:yes stop_codon:yes gene_type:complete
MKDLKKISTRLEIAKKKIKKNQIKNKGTNVASLGKALKISTELVAAVVVGSTLGFILDNWFDTKPWLTICFFFMGVAAGILNVIKSAKKMHKNFEK